MTEASLPARTPPLIAGLRCVVIGAGGFIGTNLLRRLEALGASCVALSRSSAFPHAVAGTDWRRLDDCDLRPHEKILRDADVVFHLLGGLSPALSARDPVASLQSSIALSLNLIHMRRGRIVFTSSGGTIYGRTPRLAIPESLPANPISFYGVEKLAIEKYLAADEWATGRPFASLRIANPFGPFQRPGRGQGVVATMAGRILDGSSVEIWGDGNIVRDFIYVEDVVDALVSSALYTGAERIFNIGSGVGRSVFSIIDDLRRMTGKDAAIQFQEARAADVPFNVLDVSRAERELTWIPKTSWNDGLRQTIDWLRAELG